MREARRHASHLLTSILACCLVFRAVNAVVVRTFFNADEFWQGPEIAHKIVYGYGHATWEWRAKLRGYAHPLIYALVYKLGDAVGARSDWFVRHAPRATHAALSGTHDVGCYRLALRWHGDACARAVIALRFLNWFVFYCETRSFSNCVEACATTWALTFWPLGTTLGTGAGGRRRRFKALVLAALACVMRPTSGVLWLALGVRTLIKAKATIGEKARFAALEAAPTALAALGASACVDRYFYGEWTCVLCNFVRFNVFEGGSVIYGAHPWHWYLTQGYPAVMGTMLPLAAIGFWRHRATKPEAFIVTFWTILGYSFAAHKEFRFLLPCLGVSLVSAASVLSSMTPSRRRFVVAALVVTNVPAALYLSVWHQAGTIAVMPHIARLAKSGLITHGGVLFATPCHQTPFYSHIHREIRMTFLDCSPDRAPGEDDSAKFTADPHAWLEQKYGATPSANDAHACAVAAALAPSRLVLFDADARRASAWLANWNFTLEADFHHAHVEVDRELQRRLLVYARDADAATRRCEAQE